MRANFCLLAFFAVLLVLYPLACHSQFQEPTKQELEMTSDPNFPGATAVFLNWEQRTDNAGHYFSAYARIKVLSEQGKEWAVVEVPYLPEVAALPIIEARTIHSDGAIIPLSGKAADILVRKNQSSLAATAFFKLPNPEVGSILEYHWTVPLTNGKLHFTTDSIIREAYAPLYGALMASQIPMWEVQQRIPVHKGSFYFNPFTSIESGIREVLNNDIAFTGLVDGERANNLVFTERLPAGVHVARTPKGEYFLKIQDLPAIPQESHQPPNESLAYRVMFYYSPYAFEEVYWESEAKRWSNQLNHLAEPNDVIRDAALQITAGAKTPEDSARRLYDVVQGMRNTDLARTPFDVKSFQVQLTSPPRSAADVWAAKAGDSTDLAILYLALAKAAGLDVHGIKVADRDRRVFDPKYLSLTQLDSILIVMHIDGATVYLDPGTKFCPFGQLDWRHALAGGIEETAKAPMFTPPNLAKDAISAHSADLIVDTQGRISGTVKILMSGPEALRWRQLNLTEDSSEVQKQLNESLAGLLPQGVTGEVANVQGLTTAAGYVSVTVKVSGRLGTVTGKRIMLPAFFFSVGAQEQFAVEDKREVPVDLHYAEQVIDDVVYHLPTEYIVESAPQSAQLLWPEHAALVIKTQPGPGVIDIKHIFARAFVLLDPKEYPALRDYYQKIAVTNQQQVVLSTGNAAAGN
jgi:hypothetical protein